MLPPGGTAGRQCGFLYNMAEGVVGRKAKGRLTQRHCRSGEPDVCENVGAEDSFEFRRRLVGYWLVIVAK
jgi:hypothetical protein